MHYRTRDNKLYFIVPGEESFLPEGSVPLSEAEAEALRLTLIPQIDPRVAAQEQIDALERKTLYARGVREDLLADFAAKAAAAGRDPTLLPAYNRLKALDDQIAVLREKAR